MRTAGTVLDAGEWCGLPQARLAGHGGSLGQPTARRGLACLLHLLRANLIVDRIPECRHSLRQQLIVRLQGRTNRRHWCRATHPSHRR